MENIEGNVVQLTWDILLGKNKTFTIGSHFSAHAQHSCIRAARTDTETPVPIYTCIQRVVEGKRCTHAHAAYLLCQSNMDIEEEELVRAPCPELCLHCPYGHKSEVQQAEEVKRAIKVHVNASVSTSAEKYEPCFTEATSTFGQTFSNIAWCFVLVKKVLTHSIQRFGVFNSKFFFH